MLFYDRRKELKSGRLIIGIISVAVLSVSCMSAVRAENDNKKSESAAVKAVSVSYSMEEETEKADDGEVIADSDYQRPKITLSGSDALSKKMTENTKNLHRTFAAESARVFNKAYEDYGEYKEKNKKNVDFNSYYLSQYYQTGRVDNEAVSMRACMSSYTGDEHGDYTYTGYNFDAKNGRLIGLADITDDMNSFRNVCISEIKRQCKVKGLSERYSSSAGTLVQDGSWYFTKAGICFTADTYQIAPYSYGAPEFTVSYDKLKDCIKDKYAYNGNTVILSLPGDTITTDLNGDGKDDEISFSLGNEETAESTESSTDSTETSSSTEDISSDGAGSSFMINDKDYMDVIENAEPQADEMDIERYYAVDLDISDKTVEIAVVFRGMDDDVYTLFLRYNGKRVTSLGEISDELFDNSCTAEGDGTVQAAERVSLLESDSAIFTYELDGDKLKKLKADMYPIDSSTMAEEYREHKILKDFTVYTEKNRKSEKKTLTSSDGKVSFPETDDEHWIEVCLRNGDKYYMYMSDFSTIETDSGKEDSADIFDNLYLAD
jgi:hypothetical protein